MQKHVEWLYFKNQFEYQACNHMFTRFWLSKSVPGATTPRWCCHTAEQRYLARKVLVKQSSRARLFVPERIQKESRTITTNINFENHSILLKRLLCRALRLLKFRHQAPHFNNFLIESSGHAFAHGIVINNRGCAEQTRHAIYGGAQIYKAKSHHNNSKLHPRNQPSTTGKSEAIENIS